MEPHQTTTPFGRRALSLVHVASQVLAKERPTDKAVHKWQLFRTICTARTRIGVTDRALSVLNALLTFHPETALTGDDLIVFPSNAQLTVRAHGMAPATLRRHLSMLVDCGLVIRRDSPNGKRYARKGRGGEITQAFGFDLSPLVVRAEEFARWADEIEIEERAIKLARERITLCRRDVVKMIALGAEESVPIAGTGPGAESWAKLHLLYLNIAGRIPRQGTLTELAAIAEELALLRDEVSNLLETHVKAQNMSASESQTERHKQNSNPNHSIVFEPSFQESRGETVEDHPDPKPRTEGIFPLGMVLDACPDIIDYTRDGISSWREFFDAAAIVRPVLGISPSAWEEAQAIMGELHAAVVVASILQKGTTVSNAGGYLRSLTKRAEDNAFSIGPMLMALIGSRKREKQRA